MATSIDVEPQYEHQYLVRLRDDAGRRQSWFHATRALVDRLRRGDEDELSVVRRTAEFLVARQEVADLPTIVELEDVLCSYEDFIAAMR